MWGVGDRVTVTQELVTFILSHKFVPQASVFVGVKVLHYRTIFGAIAWNEDTAVDHESKEDTDYNRTEDFNRHFEETLWFSELLIGN